MSNRGDLTIGFGHGRPLRSHARLAHTRGPWKLVLEVLGIGDNGLPINRHPARIEAPEMEDLLFGSFGDEGCDEDSDDESDSQMPALVPAEPYEPYLSEAMGAWAYRAPMPSFDFEERYFWSRNPFNMPSIEMMRRVAEAIANGRAAEVTAESPTDNHVAAAPEPQAMEVSAGSSNEEPGSSSAGPFVGIDEKPIHFPSTTSVTRGWRL